MQDLELFRNNVIHGDVLEVIDQFPDQLADMVVTSPPYYKAREYQDGDKPIPPTHWPACELKIMYGFPAIKIPEMKCCLGHEPDPLYYVAHMVLIFEKVRAKLKDTGTLWLNIGDTWKSQGGGIKNGLRHKDMIGIPFMVAFALRTAGWYLRMDNIWSKPNPLTESVNDRPTKSHEYIFLLSKQKSYYYDGDAIRTEHKSESVKRAARARSEKHKMMNGAPGQTKHSPHKAKQNLNNKRTPSEVFAEGESLHEVGANKRSVWEEEDPWTLWQWLLLHGPADVIKPLLDKYVQENDIKHSVWWIANGGIKESHFAAYPEKLITPCVLAGTSRKGNCATCGAPYRREADYKSIPTQKAAKTLVVDQRNHDADRRSRADNFQKDGKMPGYITQVTTNGWVKTCKCKSKTIVKPIVFDPFMGSGTTAIVAEANGCDYAGIEISKEYVAIKDTRMKNNFKMFYQ